MDLREESQKVLSALLLQSVEVRPIVRNERTRWDRLMAAHHYLGFHSLVGESIRYVALSHGQWVALLGWSAASLKCKVRDQWIGWPPWLQWQRLPLIANNARFLILPGTHVPNLASRILSLNLKRLSHDWQAAYHHPIWVAETFVDPRHFAGTCYRAAGWIYLGTTRGFGRRCGHYNRHDHPKMVFLRPLHPQALQRLRDPQFQPPIAQEVKTMKLSKKQAQLLLDCLRKIPDPRMRRGIRHQKISVLAITLCALLCNARGFSAIAEWAALLPQSMLRRLGCRYDRKTTRFLPPSEPTIRRFLHTVDAQRVDHALCSWFDALYPNDPVAVDGKTLKGARKENAKPVHLLSAFLHHQATVLAQCAVEQKTNEIPMVPTLLEELDLTDRVVTLDAMHTQKETARYLVEDKKADYLLIVKDNQKTLRQDIADLNLSDVPPSAPHDR